MADDFKFFGGQDGATSFPFLSRADPAKTITAFNYNLWADNSKVYLHQLPGAVTSDYANVVRFESLAQRDAYFKEGVTPVVINQMVRPSSSVRLPVPYDKAMNYNYLAVYAPAMPLPGQGKDVYAYFYFIDSIDFVAPNTTEFWLTLDVFQTYAYDDPVKQLMLEQGHHAMTHTTVDAFLGEPIKNLEGLLYPDVSFGELTRLGIQHEFGYGKSDENKEWWAIIASTTNPFVGQDAQTFKDEADIFFYSQKESWQKDQQARPYYFCGYDKETGKPIPCEPDSWDYKWSYNNFPDPKKPEEKPTQPLTEPTVPMSKYVNWIYGPEKFKGSAGIYYIAMSMEHYNNFLFRMRLSNPAYYQGIKGCIVAPKALVTHWANYETSIYFPEDRQYPDQYIPVHLARPLDPDFNEEGKNIWNGFTFTRNEWMYPERYDWMTKLYTSPYSAVEIIDPSGTTHQIPVQEFAMGKFVLQLFTNFCLTNPRTRCAVAYIGGWQKGNEGKYFFDIPHGGGVINIGAYYDYLTRSQFDRTTARNIAETDRKIAYDTADTAYDNASESALARMLNASDATDFEVKKIEKQNLVNYRANASKYMNFKGYNVGSPEPQNKRADLVPKHLKPAPTDEGYAWQAYKIEQAAGAWRHQIERSANLSTLRQNAIQTQEAMVHGIKMEYNHMTQTSTQAIGQAAFSLAAAYAIQGGGIGAMAGPAGAGAGAVTAGAIGATIGIAHAGWSYLSTLIGTWVNTSENKDYIKRMISYPTLLYFGWGKESEGYNDLVYTDPKISGTPPEYGLDNTAAQLKYADSSRFVVGDIASALAHINSTGAYWELDGSKTVAGIIDSDAESKHRLSEYYQKAYLAMKELADVNDFNFEKTEEMLEQDMKPTNKAIRNRDFDLALIIAENDRTRAKENADKQYRAAMQAIKNAQYQEAFKPPVTYGKLRDNSTYNGLQDSVRAHIITQPLDAIEQAAAHFERYGYATHELVSKPDLQPMTGWSYWKASEVWLGVMRGTNEHKERFRRIFTDGVTVWNKFDDIGNLDKWTNKIKGRGSK